MYVIVDPVWEVIMVHCQVQSRHLVPFQLERKHIKYQERTSTQIRANREQDSGTYNTLIKMLYGTKTDITFYV